jgi:hypothetical protein
MDKHKCLNINKMIVKEEITISISGDIAKAIQRLYGKEDYSLMIEDFFRLMLPRKRESKEPVLSARLRGCAVSSGLVDKTDKEIKEMMYKEKYGI